MAKRMIVGTENFSEKLFALLYKHPAMMERDVVARVAGGKSKASKAQYRLYSQYRHDGWLIRDPEGRVSLNTRQGALKVNPRGFGFVVNAEFPGDDVFVPERWLLSASHEDQVLVWIRRDPSAPGPEGRVMDVLHRATTHVVGRLDRMRTGGWRVIPKDARRPIVWLGRPLESGLHGGMVVSCRISEWPLDPKRPVRGELEDVLGSPEKPGMDVKILMAERQLKPSFPAPVVEEARRLPETVRDEDIQGRLDLRDKLIVTIDGKDAKDLDDAISAEVIDDGWLIGVHIADVSHYVPEGSALDMDARQRGTSVYLVDRVIPMLPERLSNGIASLNPRVDRLTVTALVRINKRGEMTGATFHRSVIRSRHRLTYDGVNALLAGEATDAEGILSFLRLAEEIRGKLRARRTARGAVDFDLPESKVMLDDSGEPVDIVVEPRGIAQSLIEEFMLLANEAVAHELLKHRLPGLFRVHDEPVQDKMDQFKELIGALGYALPKAVTPKSLQEVLERVKGRPEERVINSALLRSMKQARYGPLNTGHFGLASDEYTHFTSPIRRYPDLWVHRVLTAFIEGRATESERARWTQLVGEIGENASAKEREAMDAERESVSMKECQYMKKHLGDSYTAVISGVAAFGVFVELPNLIEGLVRAEDLPRDTWVHDPIHYRLVGERTGRVFRLGDQVEVRVRNVDVGLRRIDFELLETGTREKPPGVKPPQAKRRRRRR